MSRKIIAIRHGKPISEGYADETLRPLSKEGKTAQLIVCEKLKQKNIQPEFILTSPLLRARQTAEVISNSFSISVNDCNFLGYDFDEKELIKILSDLPKESTVILVGHEPTLAEFINHLVGNNVLPNGLSKSSAAIIEFADHVDIASASFVGYILP